MIGCFNERKNQNSPMAYSECSKQDRYADDGHPVGDRRLYQREMSVFNLDRLQASSYLSCIEDYSDYMLGWMKRDDDPHCPRSSECIAECILEDLDYYEDFGMTYPYPEGTW